MPFLPSLLHESYDFFLAMRFKTVLEIRTAVWWLKEKERGKETLDLERMSLGVLIHWSICNCSENGSQKRFATRNSADKSFNENLKDRWSHRDVYWFKENSKKPLIWFNKRFSFVFIAVLFVEWIREIPTHVYDPFRRRYNERRLSQRIRTKRDFLCSYIYIYFYYWPLLYI